MDMSAATRGISMSMLKKQHSQRTIDECIKKEYIELRSWFVGNFDVQDKDEHKYRARSGGIYIPTTKGENFFMKIEEVRIGKHNKREGERIKKLTDKELCRASDMDEGF